MSGLPFVLSGPSGCGKTTLTKMILDSCPDISESISHTTRPPRRGEEDGVHYHFVNQDEFAQFDLNHGFLESEEVHGFYYGTAKDFVERELSSGRDVLFVLDINGGMEIKRKTSAVTIFIVPPSIDSLRTRLIRRGTDSSDIIDRRMKSALDEIDRGLECYDYVVHNNKLEVAFNDILAIIRAEKIKKESRAGILNLLKENYVRI